MELSEKYPQLNKDLMCNYGDTYQLDQTVVDRLLQFVMTLSESEKELRRKEVDKYDYNRKRDDNERDKSITFRRSNKKFLPKSRKRNEKQKQKGIKERAV